MAIKERVRRRKSQLDGGVEKKLRTEA